MNDLSNLDDTALGYLLDALEKYPPENDQGETAHTARVLHDLYVHRVELEQQNRELQAMQEKLEASRDRYADLYEFAPVAYLTVNGTGSIKEINLTGAKLLGRERQNLVGMSLAGFAERGSWGIILSYLRKLRQSIGLSTETFSLASADGSKLIVRAQGEAIPATGLINLTLVDITARRAEQGLVESQDNYKTLRDYSGDLMSCHEPSGIFFGVSPSFGKTLGYKSEELIGRAVFDLCHPDDREAFHTSYATVLTTASTNAVRCRMRHIDRDYLWFEIESKAVEAVANVRTDFVISNYRQVSAPSGDSGST